MTRDRTANPLGREDVILRQLDEDWVLYDPVSNQLHIINVSAALIWEHCDGDTTLEQICSQLAGSFEDNPSEVSVAQGVDDALATFAEKGLLL